MDKHPAPPTRRWHITMPDGHETVTGTKLVVNEAGALVVLEGRDAARIIPAGRWLDCEVIA